MDTLALAAQTAGKGQAIFFWLFALVAVGGALAMITRRNAVSAVMSLVATILALAALFVMLSAGFLAVIQVIVYAGAIMVLFVFVIMVLNKEEDQPWALRGLVTKGLATIGMVYLTWRLVDVLWQVPGRFPEPRGGLPPGYGTTRAVGAQLFTSYLFAFEAISLVLLIGVVGALVLAKSTQQAAVADPDRAAQAPPLAPQQGPAAHGAGGTV